MKITRGMVNHLNNELKNFGVGFEYIFENEDISNPTIRISVVDPKGLWVNSSIVNCSDEYFCWLEDWFKNNYDVTLCYNNTREIICSNIYADSNGIDLNNDVILPEQNGGRK